MPFVGKDVPSQSSEFAHPDVIIGLTILAYRYSGLRWNDYSEIIDDLTAAFTVEIGPSRDRKSSRRHEEWVLASGGTIRGITTTPASSANASAAAASSSEEGGGSENSTATTTTTTPAGVVAAKAGDHGGAAAGGGVEKDEEEKEEEKSRREMVQLKYLRKSNEEQMEKLYALWRKQPLVIHHYLQKKVLPEHMRSQTKKISASGQSCLSGRQGSWCCDVYSSLARLPLHSSACPSVRPSVRPPARPRAEASVRQAYVEHLRNGRSRCHSSQLACSLACSLRRCPVLARRIAQPTK